MYASNKTQERSPWWAGIARFIDQRSDTFIGKMLKKMFDKWQRNLMLLDDNPQLAYQQPIKSQPQPVPWLQYEIPQAEPQPYLKQKQPFEDYFYRPSQGIEQPDLTRINGVENTLYQTTYQTQKYSFYQASKPSKAQKIFGYGNNNSTQYEQPKSRTKALAYSQPIETVFYEPKHNDN
jgi:hypothetical protein